MPSAPGIYENLRLNLVRQLLLFKSFNLVKKGPIGKENGVDASSSDTLFNSSKDCHSLKFILGQKNFGSQKNVGPKNCGPKTFSIQMKMLGPKKIWV